MPRIKSPFISRRQIEPTSFGNDVPSDIISLADELVYKSGKLSAKLPQQTASNLTTTTRIMNTYYSNLIEGHKTLPRDIERGLNDDFDQDTNRRNLQLEAVAHTKLQIEIDRQASNGELQEPASKDFILSLHRKFYADAPQSMLQIGEGDHAFQMIPGQWRSQKRHDVFVGRHLPPASNRVAEFMDYFEEKFKFDYLDKREKIIALAVSHHRFNFIHPFPDGNGRISRLMSHAMVAKAGIGSHGLWSVSRGLARGLDSRSDYKLMLSHADTIGSEASDGKKLLSIETTRSFTVWFLAVCLDQIEFMTELFDFGTLKKRIHNFVTQSEGMKPEAVYLLEEAFLRGEFDRGAVPRLTGLPERSARRVLKSLTDLGLLASETPKGPVSMRFPVHSMDILFPKLFPSL